MVGNYALSDTTRIPSPQLINGFFFFRRRAHLSKRHDSLMILNWKVRIVHQPRETFQTTKFFHHKSNFPHHFSPKKSSYFKVLFYSAHLHQLSCKIICFPKIFLFFLSINKRKYITFFSAKVTTEKTDKKFPRKYSWRKKTEVMLT